MDTNENKPNSSFLPVLLIGLMVILGIQLFTNPNKQPPGSLKRKTTKTKKPSPNGTPSPTQDAPKAASGTDFAWKAASIKKKDITIDTGNHLFILNPKGGRIERLYVQSTEELHLPTTITQKSPDPIEKERNAIEITRGNGMDFQFHLYYAGKQSRQLAVPYLNQAPFVLESIKENKKAGFTEVVFRLPEALLKGQRMEIKKIYRFIQGENYFRQITVLRNLDNKEFKLTCPGSKKLCDLFFKPFSDLGPAPEADMSRRTLSYYGRFFYYGDELITRTSKPHKSKKHGGCSLLPFGCGNPDSDGVYTTRYNSIPDGLSLIGSHSRYFIAYTDLMTEKAPPLDKPDGLVYKNHTGPDGRDAFTLAFHRFRLSAHKPGELDLGSIDGLLDSGAWTPANKSNQRRIEATQYEHSDALIVNNKVFVGIRTNESHEFANPKRMAAEFGTDEPNPKAHNAIYTNRFYAFFSPIQSIIVKIMHWLYGLIGNYGWSIIIIAVSFKLATFPLNQIQAKSMKKMRDLKPQIDKLNEAYADDPQEKQKKLMELYRKEGVNPAKGCLPIIVQMPIFFALYSAFSSSIELWGSPFVLWITDLSKPDTLAVLPIFGGFHLNILPLLMVVTQILQQHFTQMTVDPQQKMMMMFMPLMMLFFFWQFPSGVTLYWIVQNILAIVWQLAVNRNMDTEPAPKAT